MSQRFSTRLEFHEGTNLWQCETPERLLIRMSDTTLERYIQAYLDNHPHTSREDAIAVCRQAAFWYGNTDPEVSIHGLGSGTGREHGFRTADGSFRWITGNRP